MRQGQGIWWNWEWPGMEIMFGVGDLGLISRFPHTPPRPQFQFPAPPVSYKNKSIWFIKNVCFCTLGHLGVLRIKEHGEYFEFLIMGSLSTCTVMDWNCSKVEIKWEGRGAMICIFLSYHCTSGWIVLHSGNIFQLLQCFSNFEFYLPI